MKVTPSRPASSAADRRLAGAGHPHHHDVTGVAAVSRPTGAALAAVAGVATLTCMSTVYHSVLADLGPRIVGGGARRRARSSPWSGSARGTASRAPSPARSSRCSPRCASWRAAVAPGSASSPQDEWDAYDPALIRWRLGGEGRLHHLQELSQLRAAVEPASAALAAQHADDAQRAEIVRLAEQMETSGAAGDLTTFLEQDVAFHRLLLRASGNAMFQALGDVVEEVLRGRTDHHLMPPTPKPEARRLHHVVADAVAGREPEVARTAMTAICVEVVSELDRPH